MTIRKRSLLGKVAAGGAISLLAFSAANATILFQDDFETGDRSKTMNGIKWGAANGQTNSAPALSTAIAHSGKYSLKFTFLGQPSGSDSWSEQRFFLGTAKKELYVQWYQYFPKGTESPSVGPRWSQRMDSGPNNDKFLRLWDDDYNAYRLKLGFSTWPYGSGNQIIFTEYGTNGNGVGQFSAAQDSKGIDDTRRGRWVKFQVHTKTATSANNDGVIEMWIDDVKTITNTRLNMYPSGGGGNYFLNGYLMGWANSGFSTTSYTYIDDVTISDTFIQPTTVSPPAAPKWVP